MFQIPASGEEPLTFAAKNLPAGLTLNAKTGLITGALKSAGRTPVEIKKLIGRVDLLVPHLGAVGMGGVRGRLTLDASEAVRMVELFQPGRVVPVHHHTFSHYVEPVRVFEEQMRAAGLESRLCVLEEGETIDLGDPCQPVESLGE